jgi:hypothetical protein
MVIHEVAPHVQAQKVCQMDDLYPEMSEEERQTILANASLIAAAPEMYALLERFVAWDDLRKLGAAPNRILDEIAESAKTTLAKARGGA